MLPHMYLGGRLPSLGRFNRKVRSMAEPHLVVNFTSRSDIQLHLISTFFAQKDESQIWPPPSAFS